MKPESYARVKRSDILLSALSATEKLGLVDTKLVDYGQNTTYFLEWFGLLEDADRLSCCKDELIAAIQSAHADCKFEPRIEGNYAQGVNLTLKVALPGTY